MSLKSVEILIAEHREADKVFDELETVIDECFMTPDIGESARQSLARISEFLDKDLAAHIKKEDEGLFPSMARFLPKDSGPIAVMMEDHQDIADFGQRVKEGAESMTRKSSAEAAARIRDSGMSLIRIFRLHMMKEERILFPIAENLLSSEDDLAVLHKFEEITPQLVAQ